MRPLTLEGMSCVQQEAYDDDIIGGGIIEEFMSEVGAVSINDEKAGAAVGNTTGLWVKNRLDPLSPNDMQ